MLEVFTISFSLQQLSGDGDGGYGGGGNGGGGNGGNGGK